MIEPNETSLRWRLLACGMWYHAVF